MGKTEFCINIIGYKLDEDPVPILYICPSQRLVESISESRVKRMLMGIPTLWEKTAKGKRDKIGEKYIAGVRLGFSWASSAIELSSHPAGLVFLDERDRMPANVNGEGDPIELAEARLATYPDGKLVITSTPTITGSSHIWKLFEEGTGHVWHLPCPRCRHFFPPALKEFFWDEDAGRVLRAYLSCPKCEFEIEDKFRLSMNAEGCYLARGQTIEKEKIVGDVFPNRTASFWVSGLCSPWRSYIEAAQTLLDAKRSYEPGRVQAVVNTCFGECWQTRGIAPKWEEVLALAGGYEAGEISPQTKLVTAGVDVQKDCLYYVVRAWGPAGESWTISYGVLFGDTENLEVWEDLRVGILNREFSILTGSFMIRLAAIDAGYRSPAVYMFEKNNPGRVVATKGHEKMASPVRSTKLEVNFKGSSTKTDILLFHFDDFYFKSFLHSKVKHGNAGTGAWHLPRNVTDEFCQQIVAEELITKATGGQMWSKVYRHNHYFDCEKLNEVAGYILNAQQLGKEEKSAGCSVIRPGLKTC